MAGVCNL